MSSIKEIIHKHPLYIKTEHKIQNGNIQTEWLVRMYTKTQEIENEDNFIDLINRYCRIAFTNNNQGILNFNNKCWLKIEEVNNITSYCN